MDQDLSPDMQGPSTIPAPSAQDGGSESPTLAHAGLQYGRSDEFQAAFDQLAAAPDATCAR
jgi:hypothetical protein